MLKKKNNLNIVSYFLQESLNKEEVKKNYIAKLMSNYFNKKKASTGYSFSLYNLIDYDDNGTKFSMFDFYDDLQYYIENQTDEEKKNFCQEVVLKVFENIFLGRVSLLDSFLFLQVLIHAKDYINFTITYDDLVKLIIKIASLFPSFSDERKAREAIFLYYDIINVLVNLRNNYDIKQSTISLQFLTNIQSEPDKHLTYKTLIKDAVQPCLKEIEQIIVAKSTIASAFFAIIEKESPALDEIILHKAKNLYSLEREAYIYIRDCKNGRFEELEKILQQNLEEMYEYIVITLRQRAPELEPYIAKRAATSYVYSLYSLGKKRFPAGEKAIIENPKYSWVYARDIIQGRFPEAEEEISADAEASFFYATEVLKGRFPKGEHAIAKDLKLNYQYKSFLKTLKKSKKKSKTST